MFPMNFIAQAAFGATPFTRNKERFKCPECGDWYVIDDPDEQGDSNLCLACQDRMDDCENEYFDRPY